MKKARRIVVRVVLCAMGLAGVAGLVAFDTVDNQPYPQTPYYAATTARVRAHTPTNGAVEGPLAVGFGRAKLTPEIGAPQDDPVNGRFRMMPLAGYGARKGKPATGVHDDLYAKAVALRVRDCVGVIVTADALIIPREVAEVAMRELRGMGLRREQVYFSATHTHCGLGSWGEGVVQEMFAGDFQPGARVWFAGCLVRAVRAALEDIKPARFGAGRFTASSLVRNRLLGEAGAIDPEFSFIVFSQEAGAGATAPTGRVAVVGSFAAHATVLSSGVTEFSGDYPGAWQREVEQRTGGVAVFLAGGVGSHSPVAGADGFEGVGRMGRLLAEKLLEELSQVTLTNRAVFGVLGTEVYLPSLHARVSNGIRLRPWLARELLGATSSTFMQAYRLNDVVWISTPCDFSGELALDLKKQLAAKGLSATVTSFNGDYIGYVIPSRYYKMDGYEPRTMSFFGPATGDYISELALRLGEAVGQ